MTDTVTRLSSLYEQCSPFRETTLRGGWASTTSLTNKCSIINIFEWKSQKDSQESLAGFEAPPVSEQALAETPESDVCKPVAGHRRDPSPWDRLRFET